MRDLFETAKEYIPGGVNSPVRAFGSVGGNPVFIKKARGPYLWDEAGKRYIDFCASWGPMVLGHTPQGLIWTIRKEISKGLSFGTATAKEVQLAKAIHSLVPSMEKLRLVSSGTEAVMSVIRLARGFTGRSKIVKIDGGYHGHVDSLLVKAGSGIATFGIPGSAGVPEELARLTLTVPFNDIPALERVFELEGPNIAALIVEPVPANMGVVLPAKNYLKTARTVTEKYESLLIFDEVITGFRVSTGGAQQLFRIKPDLTCLGKVIGGGLPIAAFGGKAAIMNKLSPLGPVYQAGTLSGNPVAVTSALWMLAQLKSGAKLKGLDHKAAGFIKELKALIQEKKYPLTVNSIGSMFTIFFTPDSVDSYDDAKKSDTKKYAWFFHECLSLGVYLPPSQFEACFISTTHADAVLRRAMRVIKLSLKQVFQK